MPSVSSSPHWTTEAITTTRTKPIIDGAAVSCVCVCVCARSCRLTPYRTETEREKERLTWKKKLERKKKSWEVSSYLTFSVCQTTCRQRAGKKFLFFFHNRVFSNVFLSVVFGAANLGKSPISFLHLSSPPKKWPKLEQNHEMVWDESFWPLMLSSQILEEF